MGIKELRAKKQEKIDTAKRREEATRELCDACEDSEYVFKYCMVDDGTIMLIWNNGDHQVFHEDQVDKAISVVMAQGEKKGWDEDDRI